MYHDPGLKAVSQVAIVCRDIEATAKRWAELLGVEPPKSITTESGLKTRMVFRGQPSDARCKLAFIKLGQVTLELIQPLGGDSSWQEGLDLNGESVHHVAFEIQDLDQTVQAFESLGMPVLHRGRYGGDNGTYVYLDSKPKLGVTIELLHSDPK